MKTLGDEYPKEQARCRELLSEYKAIGPAGMFGHAMISQVLRAGRQGRNFWRFSRNDPVLSRNEGVPMTTTPDRKADHKAALEHALWIPALRKNKQDLNLAAAYLERDRQLKELRDELEAAKHDLSRHISIASSEANARIAAESRLAAVFEETRERCASQVETHAFFAYSTPASIAEEIRALEPAAATLGEKDPHV